MKPTTIVSRSSTRRHDWVNERSRALHAAIAEKIRRDPALLEIPRQNLARWLQDASVDSSTPHCWSWQVMIEGKPLEELLAYLVEESELADQLRQSSPFTGILTQQQQTKFLPVMRRSDLEHIIRASSAIAGDNEIIAIGSQSILGQFPNAPAELLRSIELDVFQEVSRNAAL